MFAVEEEWSHDAAEDKGLSLALFGKNKILGRKSKKKVSLLARVDLEQSVPLQRSKEHEPTSTRDRQRRILQSKKRGIVDSVSHDRKSIGETPPQTKKKKVANTVCLPERTAPTGSGGKATFRSKMQDKMEGARFRWLNEQLYSMPSDKAKDLFDQDPQLYVAYHTGFRTQVTKWPCNPLERVISYVKQLPVSYVAADFGCGEAQLAQSVPQRVYSFDLVASNERVTVCDMKSVPIENMSVDVCVFCLSLMGTNITDFLLEARRVLKRDGLLKICEIASRFESLDTFVADVETLGFQLLNKELFSKMFVDVEFKLVRRNRLASIDLPEIQLNPCMYKKR